MPACTNAADARASATGGGPPRTLGAGIRIERAELTPGLAATLRHAALNAEPDLAAKRDIVQNAIDLARAISVPTPKVAILSAVETVNPALRSSLDAAALAKMAERGQILGGVVDGPLAFDDAVSPAAARVNGIASPVAGQADILVVPGLESGNMLAKQLDSLGESQAAGIVLGARVPILLTGRASQAGQAGAGEGSRRPRARPPAAAAER